MQMNVSLVKERRGVTIFMVFSKTRRRVLANQFVLVKRIPYLRI